jgi:hypothetical protein
MPPNSLLLSRPVFRGIRNNLLVKNRVSGALNGIDASRITAQQLAALLEVENLLHRGRDQGDIGRGAGRDHGLCLG